MKIVPVAVAAAILSVAPSLSSAEGGVKADEQVVLQQILTDKRSVFANNMGLTEKESEAFWPIYDQYETELKAQDKKWFELLNIYARDYDTFTDDQAVSALKVRMQLQSDRLALQHKYQRKVATVLPPKKALRYAQIESRVNNIIMSDMLSIVPLAR
jgi:hypothetical protein